jgi:hypothetical protein
MAAIEENFRYCSGVPTTAMPPNGGEDPNIEACRLFIDAIKQEKGTPALVVIDTMARSLRGLDENSAAAANLYLDNTERFRQGLKCTVLTVAHMSNKGDSTKKTPDFRGSSAFSAGFDAVWYTEKNDANATVMLKAKWLKDADEDRMQPVYFQLSKIDLGQGQSGVALKAVSSHLFNEGRDEETETKAPTSAEIHAGLERLGACPGKTGAWTEENGIGRGGVTTANLAKAILHNRGEDGTAKELANLGRYLSKAAKKPAINSLYVATDRGGNMGRIWAILREIPLVEDA